MLDKLLRFEPLEDDLIGKELKPVEQALLKRIRHMEFTMKTQSTILIFMMFVFSSIWTVGGYFVYQKIDEISNNTITLRTLETQLDYIDKRVTRLEDN